MFSILIPGLMILAAALWFFLETREKKRAVNGAPRLATWRLIVAAVFALLALFSGGCSVFLLSQLAQGPQQYLDVPAVLIIGGIPFAVSLLIWWLSMRRKT